LKEEALDRTMWRARFGRGFEPVVRQTTKWMKSRRRTAYQSNYLYWKVLNFKHEKSSVMAPYEVYRRKTERVNTLKTTSSVSPSTMRCHLITFKADSHIACRAHAVPLPCRAAKGLECVFPIWFTQCGRVWFTLHIFMNKTRPHCVNQMGKTHSKPLAARHGRGTAWARHAMCESAFTGSKLLNPDLQGSRSRDADGW
jgi:hypothetical protein